MPYFLHDTVGCASSKALIQRSQMLLKCLSLTENCFFKNSSCCVFARKLICTARQNARRSEYNQNTKYKR